MNWLSEAPLAVKYVVALPSGPTKLNGPLTELLAAAWKRSVVLAGVEAVQETVDQFGVLPAGGLLSLDDEIRSPEVK